MLTFQIVDREERCPIVMNADAAPGSTTQTTKSRSRKCCRHGMTAAGNFAVVLTLVLCLVPHYHCIPIPTPDGQHWWYNPCGPGEEVSTRRPAAAARPLKSFKRLKTQLGMAHDHYSQLPLEEIYSEVADKFETNYTYHWLPGDQIEWFMNKFGTPDTNIQEMVPDALYQLHKHLQTYAESLDKLYHHKHKEEHSQFGRKRTKILFELCLELKKVLCEIEAFLSAVGKQQPDSSANFTAILADKYDTRPDKTAVLIQDYGYLNKYGKFLMEWMSIVEDLQKSLKNRKTKNKGPHKNRVGRQNKRMQRRKNKNAERRRGEESTEPTQRASSVEVSRRVSGGARREHRNKGEANARRKAARTETSEV